jgi:hypothetical protein
VRKEAKAEESRFIYVGDLISHTQCGDGAIVWHDDLETYKSVVGLLTFTSRDI